MYAPDPTRRAGTIEVRVKMADGPDQDLEVAARPARHRLGGCWLVLRYYAGLDANLRPQLAHWVVRQVTTPGERPVAVEMILQTQTQTLLAPADREGDSGRRPPSVAKIIYQEHLTRSR